MMWWRSGIGEWPEVEVRIWVYIGFTKHPSGAPMVANRSHRNFRSLSGGDVVDVTKKMGNASETIIPWVTVMEADGGSFT